MTEGTIQRKTERGFGFIKTSDGRELFFHRSAVEGTTYEELTEGQRVTFEVASGPKGPRAESVRVA